MKDRIYLGDGVYAEYDGYQIKLICDCMSEPNAIYLEPEVLARLNIFYAQAKGRPVAEDANEQTS